MRRFDKVLSRTGTRALAALLVTTIVAGCAGQGTLQRTLMSEPTFLRVTEERAFAQALRQRYLELATNAFDRGNVVRSDFYSLRAIMALEGKLVEPAALRGAQLNAEQQTARARLVSALAGGVRLSAPQAAARAQSGLDCWILELGADGDPAIAAACRENTLEAIASLEGVGVGVGAANSTLVEGPVKVRRMQNGSTQVVVANQAPTSQNAAPRAPTPQAQAPVQQVIRAAPVAQPVPAFEPAQNFETAQTFAPQPVQATQRVQTIQTAPPIQRAPATAAFAQPGRFEAMTLPPQPQQIPLSIPAEPLIAAAPAPAFIPAPTFELQAPVPASPFAPAGVQSVGVPFVTNDQFATFPTAPDFAATGFIAPPIIQNQGSFDQNFGGQYVAVPAPFIPASPVFVPAPQDGSFFVPQNSTSIDLRSYEYEPTGPARFVPAIPAAPDLPIVDVLSGAMGDTTSRNSVFFGFDSAALTLEAEDVLLDVVERATVEGRSRVILMGFTDSSGDARYNQLLAMRRSQAVRQFIQERSSRPLRFEILPVGEKEAVRLGGDGVSDALKRKVDVVLR